MPGAEPDLSSASYVIREETHTLGNALRWMIMKKWVPLLSTLSSLINFLLALMWNFAVTGDSARLRPVQIPNILSAFRILQKT